MHVRRGAAISEHAPDSVPPASVETLLDEDAKKTNSVLLDQAIQQPLFTLADIKHHFDSRQTPVAHTDTVCGGTPYQLMQLLEDLTNQKSA
jgi:hypothetical protein